MEHLQKSAGLECQAKTLVVQQDKMGQFINGMGSAGLCRLATVGAWFLIALPRKMILLLMGGNLLATLLLAIGIVGAIAAIILMSRALRTGNIRLAGYWVLGIMSVVILSMVVIREILRIAYLQPYFHPEQFAVKTQWSVFPLFLVLFVAGVVLWFVMLKRYGVFARPR